MGRTCLAAQDSSLWSAKMGMWHRVTSRENCCLQLEMGAARALRWQRSHGRVGSTGWQEVVLGSSSVALNSVTYLSFLEGLLGQRALLQPCEGVEGWELGRAGARRNTQPGKDRAARGHCVPSSSLCTPLKPPPCKARSQRHSPCPRAHFQELGKLRHLALQPCRGTEPAAWHVLANTAAVTQGWEGARGWRSHPGCRQGALVGLGCALAPSRVV